MVPTEITPIPHLLGYGATPDGRIWSRLVLGQLGSLGHEWRELKGCLVSKQGHRSVKVSVSGKQKRFLVHRLILEVFQGPCPDGMEACHCDGNATNNRIENLRWDTPANNHRDKLLHGTHSRGEKHGQAKLSNVQANEIRDFYASGHATQREIAEMYGITQSSVSRIVTFKSFQEVKDYE